MELIQTPNGTNRIISNLYPTRVHTFPSTTSVQYGRPISPPQETPRGNPVPLSLLTTERIDHQIPVMRPTIERSQRTSVVNTITKCAQCGTLCQPGASIPPCGCHRKIVHEGIVNKVVEPRLSTPVQAVPTKSTLSTVKEESENEKWVEELNKVLAREKQLQTEMFQRLTKEKEDGERRLQEELLRKDRERQASAERRRKQEDEERERRLKSEQEERERKQKEDLEEQNRREKKERQEREEKEEKLRREREDAERRERLEREAKEQKERDERRKQEDLERKQREEQDQIREKERLQRLQKEDEERKRKEKEFEEYRQQEMNKVRDQIEKERETLRLKKEQEEGERRTRDEQEKKEREAREREWRDKIEKYQQEKDLKDQEERRSREAKAAEEDKKKEAIRLEQEKDLKERRERWEALEREGKEALERQAMEVKTRLEKDELERRGRRDQEEKEFQDRKRKTEDELKEGEKRLREENEKLEKKRIEVEVVVKEWEERDRREREALEHEREQARRLKELLDNTIATKDEKGCSGKTNKKVSSGMFKELVQSHASMTDRPQLMSLRESCSNKSMFADSTQSGLHYEASGKKSNRSKPHLALSCLVENKTASKMPASNEDQPDQPSSLVSKVQVPVSHILTRIKNEIGTGGRSTSKVHSKVHELSPNQSREERIELDGIDMNAVNLEVQRTRDKIREEVEKRASRSRKPIQEKVNQEKSRHKRGASSGLSKLLPDVTYDKAFLDRILGPDEKEQKPILSTSHLPDFKSLGGSKPNISNIKMKQIDPAPSIDRKSNAFRRKDILQSSLDEPKQVPFSVQKSGQKKQSELRDNYYRTKAGLRIDVEKNPNLLTKTYETLPKAKVEASTCRGTSSHKNVYNLYDSTSTTNHNSKYFSSTFQTGQCSHTTACCTLWGRGNGSHCCHCYVIKSDIHNSNHKYNQALVSLNTGTVLRSLLKETHCEEQH